MEGQGSSEMQFTEIETNAGSLDSSVIFHVINDVAGFVLYMHQQIPSRFDQSHREKYNVRLNRSDTYFPLPQMFKHQESYLWNCDCLCAISLVDTAQRIQSIAVMDILQDNSLEFDALQTEFKELDMDLRPTSRRMNLSRKREIKQGIRRLEKLMNTISSLQTALRLLISEIPNIQEVIFVLGASPLRPQHIYQLYFSHGKSVSRGEPDFTKGKAAEGLSRKAIRTLISKGAGSDSYPGPTKLFLLVKASSSLSMPLHFLPKRDFRYSKKIVPFRLRFKCKMQDKAMDDYASQACSPNLRDYTSDDLIWFQCRHIIKGIAFKTPAEE